MIQTKDSPIHGLQPRFSIGPVEFTDWLVVDFETRSPYSPDDLGYENYAYHPDTEILLCCYKVHSQDRVYLYPVDGRVAYALEANILPLDPDLEYVITGVSPADVMKDHNLLPLVASNAAFDLAIWDALGWDIGEAGVSDLMAVQRSYNLPGGLDAAAQFLLGEGKDEVGKAAVRAMNAKVDGRLKPFPDVFVPSLAKYCAKDVRLTDALTEMLGLYPDEVLAWLATWNMNKRGFCVDTELAAKAIHVLKEIDQDIALQVQAITGGQLDGKALQSNQQLADWLQKRGIILPTTPKGNPKVDKDTLMINAQIKTDPDAEFIARARVALKSSASKKYQTLIDSAGKDNRVRDTLIYHQARTGRWAGRLLQPQNLKRVSEAEVVQIMKALDRDDPEELGPDPIENREQVGSIIRACIKAEPDHVLISGDLSQIETRVLFWLAGETSALQAFRAGKDLYCEMASRIFNRPITKADKKERHIGKAAVLGLGFGQGATGFAKHYGKLLSSAGITAAQVVSTYRNTYTSVSGPAGLWAGYGMASKMALQDHPGGIAGCCFIQLGNKLIVSLPSDRVLIYWNPCISEGMYGQDIEYQQYEQGTWGTRSLYPGKLTENIVQAIARDILADSLITVEGLGMKPVLTVHDEILIEAPEAIQDDAANILKSCLIQVPDWAEGLPLDAELNISKRYLK